MATNVQDVLTLLPTSLVIDTQATVNGANGADGCADSGRRLLINDNETDSNSAFDEPLTEADFLAPKEGDQFMQGPRHEKDTGEVKSIFRYLYRNDPTTVVLSDVKMLWGIKGLSEPAPDVAVIPNVFVPPEKLPSSFDIVKQGTRPRFVLEVVSPKYRKADKEDKVPVYEQAEIEEYVFIDHTQKEDDEVEYEVKGYRLAGKHYVPIQPNKQGWIYSQVNDVWIGPNDTKHEVWVIDAKTGTRILPAFERAEAERQARQEAEQKAQEEAMKRQEEAMKRQEAERQAQEEAMKHQEEAQKRQEAERQAQAMAAELARLREILELAGESL